MGVTTLQDAQRIVGSWWKVKPRDAGWFGKNFPRQCRDCGEPEKPYEVAYIGEPGKPSDEWPTVPVHHENVWICHHCGSW